jgi:hypothetical protein
LKKRTNTLYDEVVGITYQYLGPAADRFVSRQMQNHLNKEPEQLLQKDLNDLIVWFCLAMGILSEEPKVVKQFEAELKELTR